MASLHSIRSDEGALNGAESKPVLVLGFLITLLALAGIASIVLSRLMYASNPKAFMILSSRSPELDSVYLLAESRSDRVAYLRAGDPMYVTVGSQAARWGHPMPDQGLLIVRAVRKDSNFRVESVVASVARGGQPQARFYLNCLHLLSL